MATQTTLPQEETQGDTTLRIACLLPAATDICIALGLADRIVGVTHECDLPHPDVVLLTKDGVDADSSSQRQIHLAVQNSPTSTYPILSSAWEQARPNLVITQDLCAVCGPTSTDVCSMSKETIATISLSPHRLEDIVTCIEQVADACNVDCSEAKLAFTSLLARIGSKNVDSKDRPTALLLEWLDPPFDGGHWIPDMIEHAGLRQAIPKEAGGKSKVLTWEQIQSAAPDLLVVACCGFGLERNLRDAQEHFANFPPSSRVFAVDGNRFFARPGPDLGLGVAILAQLAAEVTKQPGSLVGVDDSTNEKIRQGVAWDKVDQASRSSVDIEDTGESLSQCALHRAACERGELTYEDPATGYSVMTEFYHKARGKCCGSGCRHCPYHHENVKDKASRIQQPAILFKGSCDGNGDKDPLKVLFFSGGKDSFLTLRALLRQNPRPFVVLLNTFDVTSRIVAHQEIKIQDIQRQATHLDMTLVGVPLHRASGVSYVERIKEGLTFIETTTGKSITSLVFGDLHLDHIKTWREDQIKPLGFQTEYPLWKVSYDVLMEDLLASKISCVVSASSTDKVKVGQSFDRAFFEQLEEDASIDSFGETGEFHSLAQVWTSNRVAALGLPIETVVSE